MKVTKRKGNLQLLLWSTILMLSVGGNIFAPPSVSSAKQTVYITRTGSKYHTHKCGNGTYYPSTLNEARSLGLTPCKKCFGSSSYNSGSKTKTTSKSTRSKAKATVKPIKISKTSLHLIKGQTSKLKIKNARKKVKWKSSKKSVVSVSSSGKLRAKRKGKATITASVGNQKKRCKVTVEAPRLNAGNITLNIGSTRRIKLSGCSHSVSWTSSNTDVAEVRSGKITATNYGTATITAKVHNKKYKCKVLVNKPIVNGITLQQSLIKMVYYEEYALSIAVSPSSALDFYDISARSTDSSIVDVSMYYDDTILLASRGRTGKATIYISVGNITKECQVEVSPSGINSLSIDRTEVALKQTPTITFSSMVLPKHDHITNQLVK